MLVKAACCVLAQLNSLVELLISCNGAHASLRRGMYYARYVLLHIPRNRRTAFLSVGTGILVIVSILDSSGLSPLVVTLWPMNGSSWSLNFSFSGFSLRLRSLHRSSWSIRFCHGLYLLLPVCLHSHIWECILMSSAMLITPSSPSRTSLCLRWNSSGAELMPKGSLSHLTLPIGVCMGVSRLHSSSRLTCVNPTSASTSVKRLALTNLWRFSSNVGIGKRPLYLYCMMALLSVLTGSMHFLIFFPGRSTAIIGEHHGVGSVTGARYPSSIISWIRLEMAGTLFTGYRRRPAWTGRMSVSGCALEPVSDDFWSACVAVFTLCTLFLTHHFPICHAIIFFSFHPIEYYAFLDNVFSTCILVS